MKKMIFMYTKTTKKWSIEKIFGKIKFLSKSKRLLLGCMFVVCGLISASLGGISVYRVRQTVASPIGNKIILIDPGHGGIDAGASSGDTLEKDLNLQIAMILKSHIEANGGVCYMTRITDTNTADPNRKKGTSQKMSDLRVRKQNISDYEADMFVSIHMNKFSQSQYHGLQVFYDDNIKESKVLGETIQETVKSVINDGNTRNAKPTGKGIYILKGNQVPSVLIECGFLSNAEETEKLKTPEYQQKLAWGIYLGIAEYFSR